MAEKKPQDPIRYLIRWSGWILLTLIISAFSYCSFKVYLTPSPTCASEVAELIDGCKDSTMSIENKLQCMDKGTALMEACGDVRTDQE